MKINVLCVTTECSQIVTNISEELLPVFFTLKMGSESSSEALETKFHTKQNYIPDESNFQSPP
jgi:hypothetical protein